VQHHASLIYISDHPFYNQETLASLLSTGLITCKGYLPARLHIESNTCF